MIARLAKFIDWSALQITFAMLPQSVWRESVNERDLKLKHALQFPNGPDFIPAVPGAVLSLSDGGPL